MAKAGFRVLAGIDEWQPALRTFAYNHPTALSIQADLTILEPVEVMKTLTLSKGELDCLVAGPPCQGFSKNVPAAYRFLEDPRNQLFRRLLLWVEALHPKTVLIENVAEIYNAFQGKIRQEIIEGLQILGYRVKVGVFFASDYGVPQRRRRCFFFASRMEIRPSFPPSTHQAKPENTLFGAKKTYLSAWSAISDLPPLANGEGYEPMNYDEAPQNEYQEEMRQDTISLYNHVTRTLNAKQYERINALKPGQGLKNLPPHLQTKGGYSGAYGRLDFKMIAPTITRWVFHPGSGRFCHPRDIRLITIREAARLQSFSDDFRFLGTYIQQSQQIGNAVPPLFLEAFAPYIRSCLTDPAVFELPPAKAIA